MGLLQKIGRPGLATGALMLAVALVVGRLAMRTVVARLDEQQRLRRAEEAARVIESERRSAAAGREAVAPADERGAAGARGVSSARERDDGPEPSRVVAGAVDPRDAKLAELEAEVDRLKRELEQAQADLRAGDPRRRQLADHLAANDLKHAALWRDLFEAALDAEAVTADPARLFAPLLALADASGVANAERGEDGRRVAHPEPGAPECALEVGRSAEHWEEGNGVTLHRVDDDEVSVCARLVLLRGAPGWSSVPFQLEVEISFDVRSDGGRRFAVNVVGLERVGGKDTKFELSEAPTANSIWREPRHGELDAREVDAGEFAALRLAIDAFAARLRTLAG